MMQLCNHQADSGWWADSPSPSKRLHSIHTTIPSSSGSSVNKGRFSFWPRFLLQMKSFEEVPLLLSLPLFCSHSLPSPCHSWIGSHVCSFFVFPQCVTMLVLFSVSLPWSLLSDQVCHCTVVLRSLPGKMCELRHRNHLARYCPSLYKTACYPLIPRILPLKLGRSPYAGKGWGCVRCHTWAQNRPPAVPDVGEKVWDSLGPERLHCAVLTGLKVTIRSISQTLWQIL